MHVMLNLTLSETWWLSEKCEVFCRVSNWNVWNTMEILQ
jgi:hypothetical protein